MSFYYDNERLLLLGEFDAREPNYSFDIVIAVQDRETGKVYITSDSGCSCPTPFEDHTFPDDFDEINSWAEARRIIDQYYPGSDYYAPGTDRVTDSFRSRVVHALKKR